MKANPGGNIDPSHVSGRDDLIATLWDRLDRQCVLLNTERRIGKTSVLRKLAQEPLAGRFPIFLDLEPFHSPEEFAVAVYEQVQKYLGTWKKVANFAQKVYEEHDFGDIKKTSGRRPWKGLLTAAIQDLVREKHEQQPVFLWDEVPYMIDNIRRKEGDQTAVEVLDTLRGLRQQHASLRMLFCGSIGLHHVLQSFREGQIPTEPVNDMYPIEVPPLAPTDAIALASALIQGEGLQTSNLQKGAETVAEEADHFPFYIHHIVSGLKQDGLPADPGTIRSLVQRQLVDANDPWDLAHFRTRIPIYYRKGNDAKLVGLILDTVAGSPRPLAVSELLSGINSRSTEFDDRDELVRLLRLMERDHYLFREPNGHIRFRFPLIQRWWKLDRGL